MNRREQEIFCYDDEEPQDFTELRGPTVEELRAIRRQAALGDETSPTRHIGEAADAAGIIAMMTELTPDPQPHPGALLPDIKGFILG